MNHDTTIGDAGPQTSVEERALRRQELTAITFVEIVDTLVDDFDVIEVLTVLTSRTVELLAASAAGILLADAYGHLRVMAASSEQIQLLELFQLQNDEGPCLDSYRTGAVVADADLGPDSPWPRFAAESVDMDQAFARLRQFARSHNRGLTEVAQAVAAGELAIDVVAGPRRPRIAPPGPAS